MNKHLIGTGLVIAVVAIAAYAVASDDERRGPNHVRASLDGYQETALPTGASFSTAGRGRFKAVIDDDAMTIEYELSYADLEGGVASQAHIHFGRPGTNGGVSAFLCGGGTKPACPATSGTVTGVIVPSDVIGPTAPGIAPGEFGELVRAIRAEATYANVHTTRGRPAGEIRGLIQVRHDRDDQ